MKKSTNSSDMKRSNRLLILNNLLRKEMSRAELARATGLTKAAVTVIVNDLLGSGVLIEGGGDGARKSHGLSLNREKYFAAGISLAREACTVGVLDIGGSTLRRMTVELEPAMTPEEAVQAIADGLRRAVEDSSVDSDAILGVGISAPGPIDVVAGKILRPADFEKWHNIPIVPMLDKLLPWKSHIEVSGMALTMADKIYGAGAPYRDFILLKVSSGVGGGIVIGDAIHHGVGGYGNEFGHMVIKLDGRRCRCGNRGCLAAYASIPALLDEFSDAGFRSWAEVVDAAYGGDGRATEIVQAEAQYLSAAIVGYINMLEPEAVILAGSVNYRPELLLTLVRERVAAGVMMRGVRNVEIIANAITDDKDVEIAAMVVVERFFAGELS